MRSPKSKPRNASKTKAGILAAAQTCFSKVGYSQAGIRDIAAIAAVSSPMLLRYFGSKAGLFEAALTESVRAGGLYGQERAGFGERIIRLFLDVDLDIKTPSIIALSTGDPDARDIVTRVMAEHVVRPLSKWLGPPDARARALEIIILAIGFVLFTRQYRLVTARTSLEKKLSKQFARTLQAIVDQ
jgi:AcrR family transcriptional regulator